MNQILVKENPIQIDQTRLCLEITSQHLIYIDKDKDKHTGIHLSPPSSLATTLSQCLGQGLVNSRVRKYFLNDEYMSEFKKMSFCHLTRTLKCVAASPDKNGGGNPSRAKSMLKNLREGVNEGDY